MKKIILKRFKLIFIVFLFILLFVISYLIYINRNNEVIAYDEKEDIEIIKEEIKEEIKEVEVKKIKIDIKGYIVNPGVYELDEGSRVIDAINISGGLLDNADTSNINLSKKLKDQNVIIISQKHEDIKEPEKIIEYVYMECECPKFNDACVNNEEVVNYQENVKEEIEDNTSIEENNNIPNDSNGLISINNGSIEELLSLPGIGESKAKAIIKYREENGLFNKIEDILNVSGIGNSLFEKIKDFITI